MYVILSTTLTLASIKSAKKHLQILIWIIPTVCSQRLWGINRSSSATTNSNNNLSIVILVYSPRFMAVYCNVAIQHRCKRKSLLSSLVEQVLLSVRNMQEKAKPFLRHTANITRSNSMKDHRQNYLQLIGHHMVLWRLQSGVFFNYIF